MGLFDVLSMGGTDDADPSASPGAAASDAAAVVSPAPGPTFGQRLGAFSSELQGKPPAPVAGATPSALSVAASQLQGAPMAAPSNPVGVAAQQLQGAPAMAPPGPAAAPTTLADANRLRQAQGLPPRSPLPW